MLSLERKPSLISAEAVEVESPSQILDELASFASSLVLRLTQMLRDDGYRGTRNFDVEYVLRPQALQEQLPATIVRRTITVSITDSNVFNQVEVVKRETVARHLEEPGVTSCVIEMRILDRQSSAVLLADSLHLKTHPSWKKIVVSTNEVQKNAPRNVERGIIPIGVIERSEIPEQILLDLKIVIKDSIDRLVEQKRPSEFGTYDVKVTEYESGNTVLAFQVGTGFASLFHRRFRKVVPYIDESRLLDVLAQHLSKTEGLSSSQRSLLVEVKPGSIFSPETPLIRR